LQSIPSGAEILDERSARLGVTPYELVVPAGGARQVRFQKPGFHSIDRRFEASTDTTIAVRLDPEVRERHAATRASGSSRLNGGSTIDPFGQPAR
ncbi:MAG TPA: PEGA domain-containing protein, partial [Polyangia bacterium]|nr:PEGA domain-containing protein [Polyangia bacterium]